MRKFSSAIFLMVMAIAVSASAANFLDQSKEGMQMCAQVITPARSPEGIVQEFPTPCDVPFGWTVEFGDDQTFMCTEGKPFFNENGCGCQAE
jgi:hypothetical protein